ncbi:MAG: PAS domain-containing protein [Pseudomonadota bacterium]
MSMQEPEESQQPALDAYCRILDLLPAAASVFRTDGRLAYYSPQAAVLWGRRPPLSGPDVPTYCGAWRVHALDGEALPPGQLPVARALATGAPVHGRHLQIERPDGSRRIVVAYASPMLDEARALTGALGLFVDVTDRHNASHAEAERLRQREELRVALACDIRAGLDPLRRSAQDLVARADPAACGPAAAVDRQLRHVTGLVDRLLNLEVDLDDALA